MPLTETSCRRRLELRGGGDHLERLGWQLADGSVEVLDMFLDSFAHGIAEASPGRARGAGSLLSPHDRQRAIWRARVRSSRISRGGGSQASNSCAGRTRVATAHPSDPFRSRHLRTSEVFGARGWPQSLRCFVPPEARRHAVRGGRPRSLQHTRTAWPFLESIGPGVGGLRRSSRAPSQICRGHDRSPHPESRADVDTHVNLDPSPAFIRCILLRVPDPAPSPTRLVDAGSRLRYSAASAKRAGDPSNGQAQRLRQATISPVSDESLSGALGRYTRQRSGGYYAHGFACSCVARSHRVLTLGDSGLLGCLANSNAADSVATVTALECTGGEISIRPFQRSKLRCSTMLFIEAHYALHPERKPRPRFVLSSSEREPTRKSTCRRMAAA